MEEETLAPIRLVEAALFTAGRPISVDEIVDATGLDAKSVKRGLKALEMEYEERADQTSLEVGQAGEKWAMQLRTIYVHHARMLAEMEIPKKLLKTLALIAFHQPLLQSDLVDMVGTKTYDHVRELSEIGLVRARQEGVSKRLTTSPTFPEYFGIPMTDSHEIRTYLAKKVGLTLKTPTGESHLETYDQPEPNRLVPVTVRRPDPVNLVHGRIRHTGPTAAQDDVEDAAVEAADEEEEAPESAAVTVGHDGTASVH